MQNILWWNPNVTDDVKYCTPFVLKILNKENYSCTTCPWYKFCIGCVLDPKDESNIIIQPTVY